MAWGTQEPPKVRISPVVLCAMASINLLVAAVAFSGGGGSGTDKHGRPYHQSCDAIGVCAAGGVCPPGMASVAPPERSAVYLLETVDGTSSYGPGKIVTLELKLTKPRIASKEQAGRIVGARNESSKYLGLLLYVVDAFERKVGAWEVPLQTPPRFWTPPDPGCAGRALMHAGADYKSYVERFYYRAPGPGAGRLIVRALVKQGETNMAIRERLDPATLGWLVGRLAIIPGPAAHPDTHE